MGAWQTLAVQTSTRIDLVDITDRVAALVPAGAAGALALFVPHTTAALWVNEGEEGLLADFRAWLERSVPSTGPYAHDRVDDNAAAHLRASDLGASQVIPVEAGRLLLGTWQRVFFVELDGPRAREVRVRLL